MLKTIHQELPFTDKTDWAWPEGDEKLVLVFKHVLDIDYIMQFVPEDRRGICIQAGGATGIWPYRFAQLFECVQTFEPQPENFSALIENIGFESLNDERVIAYPAALSDKHENVKICNHITEAKNYGAGYIVPAGDSTEGVSQTYRIDDLILGACDLIQLDIEGFELRALQGAVKTITKYLPTIVLEEKELAHMPPHWVKTEARDWLKEKFGYRQVGAIHRDLVLRAEP